jgi:CBS domain-containing protein
MAEMTASEPGAVTLRAETAADLMTPNPLSLRDTASVREAAAFLIDKAISGAPVIDEAGRPVGVLTQTDLLIYDRQKVEHLRLGQGEEVYESGHPLPRRRWDEFQVECVDPTPVRDLMTPAVFSVTINMPAATVVEEMCDLNVHRLFVVDGDGILVGVISALDVLRHLRLPGR